MGKRYNINPGDVFGRLVVVGKVQDAINKNDGKHMSQYLCRCSCPNHNLVIVKGKNLVSGDTKSCGCLLRETASIVHSNNKNLKSISNYNPCIVEFNIINAFYKMHYESLHGTSDQIFSEQIPIYWSWLDCNNINLINFYNSMCSTYIDYGYKICRIDKNNGFRPDNCYWGLSGSSNSIEDKFIKIGEYNFTVSEWNIAMGYEKDTIKNRLLNGYSDMDAVLGKDTDMKPINAIFFINKYKRPINEKYMD